MSEQLPPGEDGKQTADDCEGVPAGWSNCGNKDIKGDFLRA